MLDLNDKPKKDKIEKIGGNKKVQDIIEENKKEFVFETKGFVKDFFKYFLQVIVKRNFKDIPEGRINGRKDLKIFEDISRVINDYYILDEKDDSEALDIEKAIFLEHNFNLFARFFKQYANQIGFNLWIYFLYCFKVIFKKLKDLDIKRDIDLIGDKYILMNSLMGIRSDIFLEELKKEKYNLSVEEIQKFMINKEKFMEDIVNIIFKD